MKYKVPADGSVDSNRSQRWGVSTGFLAVVLSISLLNFLLLPLLSPALDQERLLVRVGGIVHRERDVVQLDVVKVGGACLGAAARAAADGEEAEEELAHHNGKERQGGVDEHAQAKGLLGDPVCERKQKVQYGCGGV